MYRINKLILNNFKFFHREHELILDCKNALIYGENGCGKSSIFWALHCLLHSSIKNNPEAVHKYFKPINEEAESIRNRHCADDEESSISIELRDTDPGQYPDKQFKISGTTVDTQSGDNPEIKLMAATSELATYRVLYKMYTASNKRSIDLFDYFVDNLMELIDFKSGINPTYDGNEVSTNSLSWWEYIRKGLPERASNDIELLYSEHLDKFNTYLGTYITSIGEDSNRILQDYFQNDDTYKSVINLQYESARYDKQTDDGKRLRERKVIPPKITLTVELSDQRIANKHVERPQSFLNEGRLTSIALAIRFAVLDKRKIDRAPKIFVMDDMMLSLDYSNRYDVLNLIFKEYIPNYQTIILTHDRNFFDFVKKYLPDGNEQWKIYEMYHHVNAYPPQPLILEHKDPLARAYEYFTGRKEDVDYIASGNALRQALEQILLAQLKESSYRKNDGNLVADNAMLDELTTHAIKLYGRMGFETTELKELKKIFRETLNQTSHFNPRSNLYRRELLRAFEIAEKLKQNKFKVLVEHDSEIELTLKLTDGTVQRYTAKPANCIRAKSYNGSPYSLIQTEQCAWEIKPAGVDMDFHSTKGFTLKELYDDTAKYYNNKHEADPAKPAALEPGDISESYSFGGKTFKELIADFNLDNRQVQ